MNFTLITKNGKVMQFYIEATAKTYQTIYGGVLVTNDILSEEIQYVN